MYKSIIRPYLFRLDPETAHEKVMSLAKVGACAPVQRLLEVLYGYEDPRLETTFCGLNFKNPFGLAAGLDKNGAAVETLSALGFGHIEVGSVTAQAQEGNPRPRIFRFPDDGALINRMGFPSVGADVVARHLEQAKVSKNVIVGVNIGKTKVVPIDEALEDYQNSFRILKAVGDYYVINVSSPNTPDLRKLQEPARLLALFQGVQSINSAHKPLLVKIAPDLSLAEIDAILDCCLQGGVRGIIATNTTLSRKGLSRDTSEQGGLSGKPLTVISREIVRHIHKSTNGKLPIIGVGGISTVEDALEMLSAGASMTQVYTGFIYEGPSLVRRLKQELCKWMKNKGLRSVLEIVGNPL